MEGMPRVQIDHHLNVGVMLLQQRFQFADILWGRILILLPEQAEEGTGDILSGAMT